MSKLVHPLTLLVVFLASLAAYVIHPDDVTRNIVLTVAGGFVVRALTATKDSGGGEA